MSVSIVKLFSYTLRKTLPLQQHIKSAIQPRLLTTAMNVSVENPIPEDTFVKSKEHTRFKIRHGKRPWEEASGERKENGESEEKKPVERIKKKKMALLLGYSGVGYFGMQRNPGVKTIEEDLFKALWEAKYVTEDEFNNQQDTQFQRSSRTDKGVSAARQIVSMKLPLEVNIDEINQRLPPCIRVFGMKRVTNRFNSKCKCDARTYSYTLPTYTFEPGMVTDTDRRQYRIAESKLEEVKSLLAVYRGTKCYHNFTEKKHFHDPSASRFMMDFTVEKVFVDSGMEFAVLLVKGQSFMLHQIRKMVGLVIAVARGLVDRSVMDRVFTKEKVMVPVAPGLGLVLDMVHYTRYDARYKTSHESLTWDEQADAVQKFKHQHIYPTIVKGELEEDNMGVWLEKLNFHSFEPTDEAAADKTVDHDEKGLDVDDDDNEDKQSNTEEKETNTEEKETITEQKVTDTRDDKYNKTE